MLASHLEAGHGHFEGAVGRDLGPLARSAPAALLLWLRAGLRLVPSRQWAADGRAADEEVAGRIRAGLDRGVVDADELRLDVDRGRADGREVRERIGVRGGDAGRRARRRGRERLEVERVRGEDGPGDERVGVCVDDGDGERDACGRERLRVESAWRGRECQSR